MQAPAAVTLDKGGYHSRPHFYPHDHSNLYTSPLPISTPYFRFKSYRSPRYYGNRSLRHSIHHFPFVVAADSQAVQASALHGGVCVLSTSYFAHMCNS
jgi:hypothetical protein